MHLLRFITVSVLASFVGPLAFACLDILRHGSRFSPIPYWLPLTFQLTAAALVLWALRRFRVGIKPFLVLVGIGLVAWFSQWAFSAHEWFPASPRFRGVETTFYEDPDVWGPEEAGTRSWRSGLHRWDSPALNRELDTAKRQNTHSTLREQGHRGVHVSTKRFYFWQAGVAHGFSPDQESIPAFSKATSRREHLLFCVSVCPFVILEPLVWGLLFCLPGILLVQIAWLTLKTGNLLESFCRQS